MTNYLKFNVLADIHWESRIDHALNELTNFGLRQYFEGKDYGSGVAGVCVVLMCRDPSCNFKRRIRFSKKERTLHMDIMLDPAAMKTASREERKREVAQRIFDEVPEVLARYTFPNFNKDAFVADLRNQIDGTGWRDLPLKGEPV